MKVFVLLAVRLASRNSFAKESDAPRQKPVLADAAFAEVFGAAFIYGKRDENGVA